ncbi:conserved hypothetical protein [delta proteobacterium NaphS2]|nr:conserved hypothetical protein [delta proteobacterium NaphS2]
MNSYPKRNFFHTENNLHFQKKRIFKNGKKTLLKLLKLLGKLLLKLMCPT